MRSGFSMLTAIGIMVLIATVMTLMVMLTTTTADKTVNIYLKEQSQLLARSATEHALLAASGHDYSGGNCLESLTLTYGDYTADINLYYIGNNMPCNANNELDDNISTFDSNGTVLIDTRVSYSITADQNISYARRTIQKL